MDGQEYLLRRTVYDHIVDHDLIGARAQKGRQLPVDALNEVMPFEGPGVAQVNARLRGDVGGTQRECMNRGALGVADEQHVVGSKRQYTGGLQRLRGSVLSQHRSGHRQRHGDAQRQEMSSQREK